MVQATLAAMGSASSEAIASFIERQFGVLIEPKFAPVYRASLLGQELLANCRIKKAHGSGSLSVPQLA